LWRIGCLIDRVRFARVLGETGSPNLEMPQSGSFQPVTVPWPVTFVFRNSVFQAIYQTEQTLPAMTQHVEVTSVATPGDLRQRARRLARDGLIPDAILTAEGLLQGEAADPYDLVMLGDLYADANRRTDACSCYERAAQAYTESSLNRTGIALCRKVLRTMPGENQFLLILAEFYERDGLVWDAATTYLDYAESHETIEDLIDAPWLTSLLSMTPRNPELLLRQAEFLCRINRSLDAIMILRRGADSLEDETQARVLRQEAEQLEEKETAEGAFNDPASEPRRVGEHGVETGTGISEHAPMSPDEPLSDLVFEGVGILDPGETKPVDEPEAGITQDVSSDLTFSDVPDAGEFVQNLAVDAGITSAEASDSPEAGESTSEEVDDEPENAVDEDTVTTPPDGTSEDTIDEALVDAAPVAAAEADPESLEDHLVPASQPEGAAEFDEASSSAGESPEELSPQNHYEIGFERMAAGHFEAAAAAFSECTDEEDLAPTAFEMWGRCLRKMGDPADSARLLRSAMANGNATTGVRYQLARGLEETDEKREALRVYQSILRLEPGYADCEERMRALGSQASSASSKPISIGTSRAGRWGRWRSQ